MKICYAYPDGSNAALAAAFGADFAAVVSSIEFPGGRVDLCEGKTEKDLTPAMIGLLESFSGGLPFAVWNVREVK